LFYKGLLTRRQKRILIRRKGIGPAPQTERKITMTTSNKIASKYSAAMEAAIRAEPVLNADVAARLAATPLFAGVSARGIIAKINRMDDVTYVNKAKVTKTGGAVEQKEAIVAEIEKFTGLQLTGLEKAPKPVLQALRAQLVS
jgi:hypothetical protein